MKEHTCDTCKNCGKNRGDHKANGLNCPRGRRYSGVGTVDYYPDQVFELGKKFKPKFIL